MCKNSSSTGLIVVVVVIVSAVVVVVANVRVLGDVLVLRLGVFAAIAIASVGLTELGVGGGCAIGLLSGVLRFQLRCI
ncbi:hypothetical protein B0T16DRAFT_399641 [Cercophora newfieldiana]|uniref:Uncharacterized protein n=1 Tax=Cercophora newfieldiana TaxID=92897 RepID=A0AA39YRF0_9PEZI|nr:hypothetical protein B0T16DRAFT_399641 [Cercophora newfieldiana]